MKYLVLSLLFISGCCGRENPNPEIVQIADHEGCKVFLVDRGFPYNAVYYTTCEGSTSWSESHGKTRTNVEVQTVIKK